MNKINNLVINFYNDKKIDYEKIKFLVDHQFQNNSNSFYIKENIFSYNYLSTEQRKSYYENMLNLMPADAEFMLEINFDSINDYQDMLYRLEKYNKNFVSVIKNSAITNCSRNFSFDNYLELINYLAEISCNEFLISIDTSDLSILEDDEVIDKININENLRGLIINSSYPFDLDIDYFLKIKEKLNPNLELIGAADDFYYLNLKNSLITISKYYNLFPELFQMIKREYEKNNISKSKKHQLKLNDFITYINKINQDKAFKFLLNRRFNGELQLEFDFEEKAKDILIEKFEEINDYIVDNK